MRVRLDYGKTGLAAELPDKNLKAVLGLKPSTPLNNPAEAIGSALRSPIGSPPLADIARGRRDACIVLCDITRPVPNRLLLPPILKTLHRAGIPKERVTLLIATGTHRPNWGEELEALVGSEIASSYRVVNHDSKDLSAHRFLGTSPNGVPIWLDKTYTDADLRITTGLIEPHFMAGFSGGRKLIMPGVAAFHSIQRWHCPRFLEHPLATNGSIHGNPVHEESLAIAKCARPDFIVDVTLDETNRTTGVFAGDLEEAWLAGTTFAEQHVRAPITELADVVVTTCAGYPLDLTYYQAVKGMVGALPAVKQGGTIIIASECAEGIGSPDFAKALKETDDLEAFVRHISQPEVFVPEEWEVEELAKATRHAEIICVAGGIPSETLAECFATPAESVEEAVQMALEKHGENASIYAIPRGPYVIPTLI